jgi:hypothetical protein
VRRIFTALFLTLAWCGVAEAQKGTASLGYYPFGYNGDTWTGVVTAVDNDKREITLTYSKGSKTQTFVATLTEGPFGWMKDEQGDRVFVVFPEDEKKDKGDKGKPAPSTKDFDLSEMLERRATVYYMARENKVNGQKVKVNTIIRIKFYPADKKKKDDKKP